MRRLQSLLLQLPLLPHPQHDGLSSASLGVRGTRVDRAVTPLAVAATMGFRQPATRMTELCHYHQHPQLLPRPLLPQLALQLLPLPRAVVGGATPSVFQSLRFS
jgi:hypothetical protein